MDILGVLGFVLSVIGGIIILNIIVAAHELGHGIVAHRNGVKVEEFALGFPPRIKSWTIKQSILGKNVEYSLNWLPLGGYVKLQGEHDAATKKGDYGAATFWVKTKILLAGIFMNWIVAVVLMSVVIMTVGVPKMIPNQFMFANDTATNRQPVYVESVVAGTPADQAGFQKHDTIVSFDSVDVYSSADLVTLAQASHGKTVAIEYIHDGQTRNANVPIRAENTDGKGYFGMTTMQQKPTTYRASWSGPLVSVVLSGQFASYTFEQLGQMFVKLGTGVTDKLSSNSATRQQGDEKLGEVNNSVGGPLAILGIIFPSAWAAGPIALLMTSALISLTLAIMNILPIPGLDGGRWFLTFLYRKILRKPLTKEIEEKIVGNGMLVLFGLIIIVTVADLWKFGR